MSPWLQKAHISPGQASTVVAGAGNNNDEGLSWPLCDFSIASFVAGLRHDRFLAIGIVGNDF
ncbi:MAG: hypothetical protein ACYDC8_00035 [Gammaproteobacteria bacterium]